MKKEKKFEITTDTALLFSAGMIFVFTIVMIIIFCIYQTVPDTLIVSFYGCFGLEGGYCAFIHKIKKEHGGNDDERTDDTDNN